ncbi:hypothetical protein AB0J86_12360 [Micromonospora sp. NPDC049559]|uniref:hypothetical protein n=1 Tax=Micromonospora sp. NPDC049559 TaxID=3155923 RepID=UPI003416485E
MSASRRTDDGGPPPGSGPGGRPEGDPSIEPAGPEGVGPYGWGGREDRDAPWGVDQDNPLDEGSEPTAVPEGRRGERRAGQPGLGPHEPIGSVEPTRYQEAGPGAPPDPAPRRRTFPNDRPVEDRPDNSIERETSFRPEGAARRGGGSGR